MTHRSLFLIFGMLFLTAGLLSVFQSASAEEAASEPGSAETLSNASEFIYDGSNDESSSVETRSDPSAAKTGTSFGRDISPDTKIYNGVMQKIMSLFAWLLGVAALTLNAAVYYTVITMGDYVKNLTAVGVAWRILRDIGNIALIFGFLAIGISTIINYDVYGWGRKMLPKLLLAAIFLNFSLLAAEAVIDVGNLFATQFYTQINGGVAATPLGDFNMQSVTNEGISNKVMAQLGMQGLYGSAINNPTILQDSRPWYVGFLGIILFIIMAFVFFSLAFILIARFVVLIYVIITSPIGFAGLAIPKLNDLANKWWSMLFSQSLTAPVLFLLLYIALAVITDASFLTGFGGSNNNADAWTGIIVGGVMDPKGFMGILLSFLVAAGLLIAVTISAKKLGAIGASGAMKLAGAMTLGATAWGARSTAGFASQWAARRFRNTRLARIPVVGRSIASALDKGAKASFDIRGVKKFGGLGALGVEAGKAHEGGYRAVEEQAIKDREAYAKTLGQTSGTYFGAKLYEGEKEQKEKEQKRKALMEQTASEIETQSKIEKEQLATEQKRNISPYDARIVAARASATAADTAHRAAPSVATQQALDRANLALNTELRDRERISGEQKKAMDKLIEEQNEALKVNKAEIEARQTEINKINRKPQESYARGIIWGPGKIGYRNTKAAANIVEAAAKSKEQKDVDTLMDLLKKSTEQRGSVGTQPPTPPAAGAPTP